MTSLRPAGHPLFLGSVVLLALNDHLLKAAWPSWWTGKLSDVAGLVVAPVVLAALLGLCRLPPRPARAGALAATGLVFAAVQLHPGLGQALLGPGHVADPTDLLALPALAGAWRCWRPPAGGRGPSSRRPWRWLRPVGLVAGALACLATTYGPDHVYLVEVAPCGGEAWPADAPLVIASASDGSDLHGRTLAGLLQLVDEEGAPVPWSLVRVEREEEPWTVFGLCPDQALRPGREYSWMLAAVLDPDGAGPLGPLHPTDWAPSGPWHFVAAAPALVRDSCEDRLVEVLRSVELCGD